MGIKPGAAIVINCVSNPPRFSLVFIVFGVKSLPVEVH